MPVVLHLAMKSRVVSSLGGVTSLGCLRAAFLISQKQICLTKMMLFPSGISTAI